jgi:hypothetical protein
MSDKKVSKSLFKSPPCSRDALRPVDKVMIHSVMFDLGIIPIEDTYDDMQRVLNQLSPKDSTKMKRKFRKLWRKTLCKIKNANKNKHDFVKRKLGVGKKTPNKHEKFERKKLVYESLWKEQIAPKLFNFENPDFQQEEKT